MESGEPARPSLLSQPPALLNKAISQRRFTMVNVRDNGKIANVTELSQSGCASIMRSMKSRQNEEVAILAR